MSFDFLLVGIFLLVVLAAGWWSGRGLKSFAEYAVGPRNYPSFIISITIFATMVGGSSTAGVAEQVYIYGIAFLVVPLGSLVRDLLTAYLIIPRFKFEDCLTPGDIMGKFYGPVGKFSTGVAGFVSCAISLGLQTSALGFFCHYFFGVPHWVGVILCAGTLIAYTTYGGLKSVTTTDVIQFSILAVGIPIIFAMALEIIGRYRGIPGAVPISHLSLDPGSNDAIRFYSMFFLFAFSGLHPTQLQRLLMDADTAKLQRSLLKTTVLYVPLFFMVAIVGLAALTVNQTMEPHLALPSVINTWLPVGARGLAIAALLAAIMSTADSYLHVAGIMFSHDVVKPMFGGNLKPESELKLARISTGLIGVISTVAAITINSLFELSLLAFAVWTPAIVAPLLAGIFGVRARLAAFLCSGLSGATAYILWNIFLSPITHIDATPAAFLVSMMVFFTVHWWGSRHLAWRMP